MPSLDQQAAAEIKRIKERILLLCDEGLQTGGPYYLSQLGIDLGKDVKKLGLLTGQKLSEFVQSELGDRLKVIPVPGRQGADVLVKVEAQSSIKLQDAKFPTPEAPPKSKTEPRYHYRFWAAFSVPAVPYKVRYLDRTTFSFSDILPNEEIPSSWILIDDQYIALPGATDRDNLIKQNIETWLAKNGLEKSEFLASRGAHRGTDQNMLTMLIDALDTRQQQTTRLPLDVVAALLHKRV